MAEVVKDREAAQTNSPIADIGTIIEELKALHADGDFSEASVAATLRTALREFFPNEEITASDKELLDRFGIRQEQPEVPELTETQQQISQRLLDTFRFGLERVNIDDFFRDRPYQETTIITSCTEEIMLSSFCRGGCEECARRSAPYSRKNRQVFDCDQLIEFMHGRFRKRILGDLRLYDASDPLDYPDIIKLAKYIEKYFLSERVTLLTSCPPGSEEVLKELFSLNLQKIRLQVSLLPSTEARQRRQGVFEIVEKHRKQALEQPNPYHHARDIKAIGRLLQPNRVEMGFACGDGMVITPTDGPCCSIHHLASSQFPDERALVPVDRIRRVYHPNSLMYMRGDRFGFGPPITTMYPTHSTYYDLDNNGESVDETSLRHIATFLYSIWENIAEMTQFNPYIREHLEELDKALRTGTFSMPQDQEELEFYIKLIPTLILNIETLLGEMSSLFGNTAAFLFGHPGVPRELPLWKQFLEETKQCLQSHAGTLRRG